MHAFPGYKARAWQVWLAAVVFVFPIPGTIALRNLLLLFGLIALLASARGKGRPSMPGRLCPAAWGLAALTGWLVLHSLVLAPAPLVALDNVRGDWVMPMLIGVLASFGAARAGARGAVLAIVAALLAHLVWVLGWQAWLWSSGGAFGNWPVGQVPFADRDYHSTLSGFLIALLVAERTAAVSAGGAGSLLPQGIAWAALGIALVGDIAVRTRNGTLTTILLTLVATAWLSRRRPRFLLLMLVVGVLGGASLALDERWSGLKESLATGWNSPSMYWLTYDPAQRPTTASGTPVEESAYLRSAWTRQAAVAIGEHPLGLGFGRDGFGQAIARKYGQPGMVSSHSGWLDFALGAGLPGLALLLLTTGLALRGGWRQFRADNDAAALMLCFLVGGYLARCMVDGHFSGWRLALFSLLCGVLIAALTPRRPAT